MITVKNVTDDKKGMKHFMNFIYDLYKDEPNWTPPLKMLMKEFFNKKRGPFFAHGEVAFFVGYIDDKPRSRVTAQVDHEYNERYKIKQGSFGFFESEDDMEMAKALMEAAEGWLKGKGCDNCIGPMNFCANDDNMGFLIYGHDRPNTFMLNWSMKYYPDLFKKLGYKKDQILISYFFENITCIPEVITKHTEKLKSKFGDSIEIRTIDMKNLWHDIKIIFDIYNEAWCDNWGFVPMTNREVDNMAKNIKKIADPNIIFLLFKNGEPAACLVGVPDINKIFLKNRKGKATPKVLWNLLFGLKKLEHFRMIIMGVRPKFRRLGLDFLLYDKIYRHGLEHTNYKHIEMGWVLESNKATNSAAKKADAKVANRFLVVNKKI